MNSIVFKKVMARNNRAITQTVDKPVSRGACSETGFLYPQKLTYLDRQSGKSPRGLHWHALHGIMYPYHERR